MTRLSAKEQHRRQDRKENATDLQMELDTSSKDVVNVVEKAHGDDPAPGRNLESENNDDAETERPHGDDPALGRREHEINEEEVAAVERTHGGGPTPMRLLFPSDTTLKFHEKLRWTANLAREHKQFKAMFREGKLRPYVTVATQEAVEFLTTKGYDKVVLEIPEETERYTKVIVFRYPHVLDADFLLDDPRFVWAKRHVVKGEERSQAIALVKGEVPGSIFIPGIGRRSVAPYVPEPDFCLNCSRWSHQAYQCQEDPRCRFCAKKHKSSVCGELISARVRVKPCCANCGGEHNARSSLCPRKQQRPRRHDVEMATTKECTRTRSSNTAEAPWGGDARPEQSGVDVGGAPVPPPPPPPPPPQEASQVPEGEREPWPRLVAPGGEGVPGISSSFNSPPPPSRWSRGSRPRREEPRGSAHPTAELTSVGESVNVGYVKYLEKKIDALEKGLSAVLEKVEKSEKVKESKVEKSRKEKEKERENEAEKEREAEVSTQCMASGDENKQGNNERRPLIHIGVDFEVLQRKWEACGKKKEDFMAHWSEMQRCLDAASVILERVAICDHTEDNSKDNGAS